MSKHTPGPWRVDGEDISAPDVPCINICAGDFGPSFYHVCDVSSQLNERTEQFELLDSDWANAHLIAAAPEMLAALEEAVRWIDNTSYMMADQSMIDKINAVIAKAKGEA